MTDFFHNIRFANDRCSRKMECVAHSLTDKPLNDTASMPHAGIIVRFTASKLLAQTAPQDAPPTATAAVPDHTRLLQTMAHDLANVERNIEQLKANQQQIASDNSKAIEQLKASHEEIKRVLARVSEQNLPKTSPPPTQPTPTLRKPERTLQSPHARARP